MKKPSIALIGAGKVGSALAIALQKAGYVIESVVSRTPRSADALARRLGIAVAQDAASATVAADLLLIATPDRVIGAVAQALVERDMCRPGQIALHVCGSQSAESLCALRSAGVAVGSMHPLQTFSDVERAVACLPGTYFAVDGDEAALCSAQEMVAVLGGKSFYVPKERRALYHAAACMASNYTVALLHASAHLLSAIGMKEADAMEALAPIMRATFDNVQAFGTVQALTGPIVRGDGVTVERHLQSIDELSPEESTIYRELGIYAQEIAKKRGVCTEEELRKMFTILHKVIHRCE